MYFDFVNLVLYFDKESINLINENLIEDINAGNNVSNNCKL